MRRTSIAPLLWDWELIFSCRSSYVDVRDLALAHALALTKPEAGGERIIVSASVYKWQDWGKSRSRPHCSPYLTSLNPSVGRAPCGADTPGGKHGVRPVEGDAPVPVRAREGAAAPGRALPDARADNEGHPGRLQGAGLAVICTV